jgi:hypothetical protein
MTEASSDVWEVMSTARSIRRFTDEPVDYGDVVEQPATPTLFVSATKG